jgi:hypothetical protein
MLKKSLIFGSVALFVAALITLTGCPTSADDGSSTIVYGHRIYGDAVDPYQAQLAIDNAVKAGEPVVLENGLYVQSGELNFKNAQVRVNGTVNFATCVVNMTDATVSWAPGAEVKMLAGGYYIHRRDVAIEGKVTPDSASVWFAEGPNDIMSTATAAAGQNFTLGSKLNFEYSQDPSKGIDARVTAEDLDTLFILDKLTVPFDAEAPAGITIIALGDMDVTGNVDGVVIGQDLFLGSCSTLTSSRGATIPVVAGPTIPNVRVAAERNITLDPAGGPNPLFIPGKLTGPGTLVVTDEISDITVNGGEGNLSISGTPAGGRQFTINSTGKVTFSDNVTIDGDSVIRSDVVFGNKINTIELDNASLALLGNVTLTTPTVPTASPDEQEIILSDGKSLTLGAGKTVSLQIITQKTNKTSTVPLLTVGTDGPVVLTPDGGNTTLTVPATPKDDPEDIAEAQRIDVAVADLEITDGTLQVLRDAIFGIEDVIVTTNVNGSTKEFGYLTVAEGGALDLILDTAVPGSAGLALDYSQVGIFSPFNFKASGGAVTLGNRRIVGSAAGTKLTPEKGSAGYVAVGTSNTLILGSIELNVAAYSGVSIDNGGKVALDKGAKIILAAGENGQATEWTGITAGGVTASLSGAYVGLYNPADVKQPVWSIAHKGGDLQAVNITADAGGITLAKTPKANFAR